MAVTFKKATTPEKSHILIVDALNLAFRWKHAGSTEFAEDYISTVKSFQKSFRCDKVIIASDAGSSTFRKEIYPGYKADRKTKAEAQSEEEKEYFLLFLEEFNNTLNIIKEQTSEFLLLRYQGCEADDIGAYIVRQSYLPRYRTLWSLADTYKFYLLSSDRDWDLMISDRVSRFSYVTKKEITAETWSEHYDYAIEDHISIKCLTGDSGDSIPGVVGIGPKKAKALIEEYGSTYDIIASMPIRSKYKHIEALNEFGTENLLRNYKLMDLISHCADALGPDNCLDIDNKLSEYLSK